CPYRLSRPRSIDELPLLSDATSRFSLAAPTTAPQGIRERETIMAEERKPIAETGTREIVGGIKGVGDIANALVDTVSGSLVKLIKGTGAVGTTLTSSLADVVRGAIQGTSQVGGDVGTAAKGAAVGVLRGTKEVGVQTLDTVSTTAREV